MPPKKTGKITMAPGKKSASVAQATEIITKCCDGEGEHVFVEGEEPDCDCYAAACGCIIDNDNTFVCSVCNECEACCTSCASCEDCGERLSKDDICIGCNQCPKCCAKDEECWTCDDCGGVRSVSDDVACNCCGACENCCPCSYCESCGENHPFSEDTKICSDCNSCMYGCSCTHCKGCGVEKDKLHEDIGFCDDCHKCDSCGCSCNSVSLPTKYAAKTQKARGLRALLKYRDIYPCPNFYVYPVKTTSPCMLLRKFVRPCPIKPRHGFVNSRYIDSMEESKQIIDEVFKADSNAEFIITDKILTDYSAVWTPGLMVIGPGNDGATAGKDSVSIPVGGTLLVDAKDLMKEARVKRSPYMEILWRENKSRINAPTPIFVQLRDGPAVSQQIDFIEKEYKIESIILAEGDLLEWETKMKEQPSGAVVYHPGGSLASHYAVHAVLNHIPVMISRPPVVGETLAPTQDGENKPNIEDLRRGFYYGLTISTDYASACNLMLLGVHSTTLWLGKQDLLLGAALGATYRLSITAAVGEWRHRPTLKELKSSREYVYDRIFDRMLDIRGLYMKTLKDFRQLLWPEGLGGEKWFQFTQWGAVIHNAVLSGDVNKALAAMNNAVNSSHNSGWGFNKFSASDTMNKVANNPVYAMRSCAPLVYRICAMAKVKPEMADAWLSKAKPFPIDRANAWVTDVAVNRQNAEFAQIKVVSDEAIKVEYRLAKNSQCYGTEIVPVDPENMAKIQIVLNKLKADGRLLTTFVPNDDGTLTDSDVIPCKDPSREYVSLCRQSRKEWALYVFTTIDPILVLKTEIGCEPPPKSKVTEYGTVMPSTAYSDHSEAVAAV